MKLYEKFANRIDNDPGYDNEALAMDLQRIAIEHFSKNGFYKVNDEIC